MNITNGIKRILMLGLFVLMFLFFSWNGLTYADTTVTATGPIGQTNRTLPDEGGTFDVNVPLKSNAVNRILITAVDRFGNSSSKELSVTQVSLDAIVVSKVTAERLTVERVEQLVSEGVIKLDDPQNYNVSTFDIVLTIANEPVPVYIPVATLKEEPVTGYEVYKMPKGGDGGGGSTNIPDVQIVVFEQPVVSEYIPRLSIPGVIIIEGNIRSLKEFFSVRLLLMNTSGIFTLKDITANIEFPDGGLSRTLPVDGIISFGDIVPGEGGQPGQMEKEFIIRGDEIGVRDVKVSFGGLVTGPGIPEDKPIPFNGSAMTEVEVKGPPTFDVKVTHPSDVVQGVLYELKVEIMNTGDITAMYASLELDVGAGAQLVKCEPDANGDPVCTEIEGAEVRNFGHILPGMTVSEVFTVKPFTTGYVSSCVGASDQNITLQVFVGNIGCAVGKFPPLRGVPDGIPTVTVIPVSNMAGLRVDVPVTAFFSELMDESTITTGSGGTFNVLDRGNNIVPGQIRFATINRKTAAIWQAGPSLNYMLDFNTKYMAVLTKDIKDKDGNHIFNEWTSWFTTTGSGIDDITPPVVTLSITPPVNPNFVIPGQLVKVNAYASDQGSGVGRVEARIKDMTIQDSRYELIDQKSVFQGDKPPYIFPIDSSKLFPGHTYQIMATAYDVIGNAQNATISLIMGLSADPPVITLPDDKNNVLYGISVDITPALIAGGVREVRFYLDGSSTPYRTINLSPYQTSVRTIGLALGEHTVRAIAIDGLDQTGEDTMMFTIVENVNMPIVGFSGISNGAQFITGEAVLIRGTAQDDVGVASMKYFLDSTSGSPIFTGLAPILLNTTGMSLGDHTVYLQATNLLGVSNNINDPASALGFSIVQPPPGLPPDAPSVTSVSYPVNNLVNIQGVSVPKAKIEVNNQRNGLKINFTADNSGNFSGAVEAQAGDVLSITAYDLSKSPNPSQAAKVTVLAQPLLTHITVLPVDMNFNAVNQYQDIIVTGHYDNGTTANITSKAVFSSGNSTVATVSPSGRVYAQTYGSTPITASAGAYQAQVAVTCAIITLQNITVDPADVNLAAIGETQQLTVTGHYSDGGSQNLSGGISFVTGDPGIASVSGTGLIKAMSNGMTQINVFKAGVQAVSVRVTVNTALDTPPAIEILSPSNGMNVERLQNVTVYVRAQDTLGGVTKVFLNVTGETTYSETKQISPASLNTTQGFTFSISPSAAIGGTVTVNTWAEDSGGNTSAIKAIILNVVDNTPPSVTITGPANQTPYNYGDTVNIAISAEDTVGVAEIRFETTGAVTFSGARVISPVVKAAGADFSFTIPFGVVNPDVAIKAYAKDAAGNERAAFPVDIIITGADITPPETIVTAVAGPGAGASTTVTYKVISGLSDLDHVELYFRRNSIGTFNRYTNADGGNPEGRYFPQNGDTGTIIFDSTKMGGDGDYEFYSVGVDLAGNREDAPASADKTSAFNSGTVWTTINASTLIGEGDTTFDNMNLRINGAVVTVNGQHDFKNIDLLNGAVLTHSDTTASLEYKFDIYLWSLSIDSTSSVNVNGKGYVGGIGWHEQGRTLGNVYGSQDGAGGSYGGLGGGYSGRLPNNVYGYLTDPQELGSGGGNWNGSKGGDGGGLVKLNAINIAVDGVIQSNGGESAGSAAGDGSGGGINISTKTLSGTGGIFANGGGSGIGTGGGGGRVAINYTDMATVNQDNVKALGGFGYYGNGANGTVVFIQLNKAELVLTGQGPSSPWIDLTIPAGYVFDSVTFRDNARVIAHDPFTVTGRILVTGNSTLTQNSGNENGLVINAKVVQVDAGSLIDVTGKGYSGGIGWHEQGRTLGNVYGASDGSGGSYGGTGSGYSGRVSGPVYGDPKNPVFLGSGGGNWNGSKGGDGGGRITINASQAVIVNGTISGNGGESAGSAAGDGSGGSVLIHTSKLSGTGFITADGGGKGDGVGGGGGRVAVYCDYIDANNNLNSLYNITAFGRNGYYDSRQTTPGTVYIRYSNQENGNLYIDANMVDANGIPNRTSADSIVLTPLGFGTTAGTASDTLTTDGLMPMLSGSLPGLRINPDINQGESFVIQSNSGNLITVLTPNEHGVNFADIASVGKTYAGFYKFDNVIFRRGGNLMVGDLFEVTDTMRISEYGMLTHYDVLPNFISWLDLTVKSLVIDSTGRIDVTGRGYTGGRGWHEPGYTKGNVHGGSDGTGGSYGGLATGYQGRASNPIYGSLTSPVDFGSGGGNWSGAWGGDGGGLIFIRANNIIVDGAIISNGGESQGSAAGDGSGGTVNVVTANLSGTGTIQANGGGNNTGSGGGGGRIAITYTGDLSLSEQNIKAIGGTGYYGSPGGNGTVYLNRQGQANGDLIIDGFGISTPSDTTRVPGGYTFDNLTIRNSARVVADEGINVTGTLLITGDSVLTHGNTLVSGLVINASIVQVDGGSAIDVTGRGYSGGIGWHEQGRTLGNIYGASDGAGGSYGGPGGGYQGRSAGLVYGDLKWPDELGSGGGNWSGNKGGNGGGRITINASQYAIINGTISADGGASGGSAAGDGSGGSILIQTPELSGNGFIKANGGGSGNGVGGGGGRVAVYVNHIDQISNLNGLHNITAFGGHGQYDDRQAAAGTVYIKYSSQQNGNLYIDNNVVDGSGNPNGASSESTPLTHIGFGTVSALSDTDTDGYADTLTTDGLTALLPYGLAGLRINPDISQAETFKILSNTGNTIIVITPNENGVNFGDIAGAGKTYAGVYAFDNVTFRRGGNLIVGDLINVLDTMWIAEYGMLTHYFATTAFVSRLDLRVGTLYIDATSRIDVTGRGYIGGRGWHEYGRTVGNVYGSADGAGGSYGGPGGSYSGHVPGAIYGIPDNPVDLGSGGGNWGGAWGGDGGGLIFITANDITIDGIISANGGESGGSVAGDGSGGSILINTLSISGTGLITSNGGGNGNGVGGGGGRVAVYYNSPGLGISQITASGGNGQYGNGSNGTVYLPP